MAVAQSRIDRTVAAGDGVTEEQLATFLASMDALASEVAKLSPEDQERLERELNEAVDGAIRRRVAHLRSEAARQAPE